MATNRDRRHWAMVALVEYAKAKRNEPLERHLYGCISDLVADLGHLAQKDGRSAGYTAFDMYEHAIGMFSAESRYPDEPGPYMDDEVKITVTRLPTQRDVDSGRYNLQTGKWECVTRKLELKLIQE